MPPQQEKVHLGAKFAMAILVLGTAYWLGTKWDRGLSSSVQRDSRMGDFGLNLKLQQQGDYWRVSWTRNPASLPKATQASLLIKDGATEKTVLLDASELASTTVLYGPAANGPVFQLLIGDERIGYRSETVRTVVASAAKPLEPALMAARHTLDAQDKTESSVSRKILPSVPMSARASIRGNIRVDVKASVSPSGEVTNAELNTPARSPFFARLALAAAKQWQFLPGNTSFRVLRFEFSKDGDHASLLDTVLP